MCRGLKFFMNLKLISCHLNCAIWLKKEVPKYDEDIFVSFL